MYISNLFLIIRRGELEKLYIFLRYPYNAWTIFATFLQIISINEDFKKSFPIDILVYISLIYLIILFLIFLFTAACKYIYNSDKDDYFTIKQIKKMRKEIEDFRNILKKSSIELAKKSINEVEILLFSNKEPKLEIINDKYDRGFSIRSLNINIDCLEKINKERKDDLTKWDEEENNIKNPVNSPHLIAYKDDIIQYGDHDIKIKCYKCDYVTLKAITSVYAENRINDIPLNIHAGGMLVYKKDKKIIFHRRKKGPKHSEHVDNHHVFGGNFEPNLNYHGRGYDSSLSEAAEREIKEESGASVNLKKGLYILLKEEASENITQNDKSWTKKRFFLPFCFFGALVSDDDYMNITKNSSLNEGDCIIKSLEELKDVLSLKNWVPAGWHNMMLWLYIGAPCYNGEYIFSKRKARNIVFDVLNLPKQSFVDYYIISLFRK